MCTIVLKIVQEMEYAQMASVSAIQAITVSIAPISHVPAPSVSMMIITHSTARIAVTIASQVEESHAV